ncbi:MAG: succinate-semialdehyde dehydrogenase (NADP(+)) [Gammaproteobacteria bacterium RIFCSPHIGHO2_12_FULL_45_9]|nr:MAG: succinate-semialdehyde dehydrogenase (NADP(+)) [Gammaproteobacteria bacterium RIFCSPHIGHO2_12_FULL_45_9]
MNLKNTPLFNQKMFINGVWCGSETQKTLLVMNPATQKTIGHVPVCSPKEVEAAIAAAETAFHSWKHTTAKTRSQLLRRWHDLILEHLTDLSQLLTLEMGKPLAEAEGELRYAAAFIEWFAEEAKRAYGEIIPPTDPHNQIFITRQPVGPVAVITPWNFPAAMITRKCGPALAAGCTVVIKPAEDTPLTALALVYLAEKAGFPAGVINIVTGDPASIGHVFLTDTRIQKISFTGSTAVGKFLMKEGSAQLKKVGLELGGNAPFIVCDDANLDHAVMQAVFAKFRNAGQTCVCVNRFFIQAGIYPEFLKRFTHKVSALTVGHGLESVNIGPLINEKGIAKLEALVADAVAKGAKIALGGERTQKGTLFYQPSIITDANETMRIYHEEIFGPVAVLYTFKTEKEAIRMANATPYGLASYAFTQDAARMWRLAHGIESGVVSINTANFSTETAPFGGVKESGIGREGGHEGLLEFMESKYICLRAAE